MTGTSCLALRIPTSDASSSELAPGLSVDALLLGGGGLLAVLRVLKARQRLRVHADVDE